MGWPTRARRSSGWHASAAAARWSPGGFRVTTPSGPLAGTFELNGQPLPDPFHVVRTTVVHTITPTFVSSAGCRTDFKLTVSALPPPH
jgi:hypothetical protein